MSSFDLGSLCFLVTVMNSVAGALVASTAAYEEGADLSDAEISVSCIWLIACYMYLCVRPVGTGGCQVGGA